RVDELLLPADQVEARAIAHVLEVPRFARRLLVTADRQHDHVRLLRDLDSLGDLSAVFIGIARQDFIVVPRSGLRDLATFGVEHLGARANSRRDAIEYGDVALRPSAISAEQRAMRVRADHGDGL